MLRPIRRTLLAAAAAGLAVLAVAGCDTDPGAAAIVGNQRISDSQLSGYVRDALSDPSFAARVTDRAVLARSELTLRVQLALFQAEAAREGVAVTDAEVASTVRGYIAQAGGRKAFDAQAVQQGVAPSDVTTSVKINLLVDALARKAGVSDPTSGEGQQQAGEIAVRALQSQARRLGVRINPRFGRWDPSRIHVAPVQFGLARPAA